MGNGWRGEAPSRHSHENYDEQPCGRDEADDIGQEHRPESGKFITDFGLQLAELVEELMFVERYSHVQHLVTSLRSRLRDGLDRFDALAACFPAGTVTGAPKIRAMQIIDELEPSPRGVYAGAILYVDYAKNLDSCIAIRTIDLRDGIATVQAGAGIVADSIPHLEYEECLNKARALFRAIEMAEKGL